jgi:hypothetical protein
MMRPNWSDWCTNLASYEAGNRNMQAYSNILEARHSEVEKLRSVIEEKDSGILAANANRNILSFSHDWDLCVVGIN